MEEAKEEECFFNWKFKCQTVHNKKGLSSDSQTHTEHYQIQQTVWG